MPLDFPGPWRFEPPSDGSFRNRSIPPEAVGEFLNVIEKIPVVTDRWTKLEHFKNHFGSPYWSSDEGWAFTDLTRIMDHAAENAPLFIESIFDACEALRKINANLFVPDHRFLNTILHRYKIGYEIDPPHLRAREIGGAPIAIPTPPPTLAEKARVVLNSSLDRSQQLLSEGRPREAVQESLWLLETVATAFRGVDTASGKIEGKYFNQIVRELRSKRPGTTTEQVLAWIATMHGYLSSPSGGGVRHGTDVRSGVEIDPNQGLLFCNLIRSYISFLLGEHEALTRVHE